MRDAVTQFLEVDELSDNLYSALAVVFDLLEDSEATIVDELGPLSLQVQHQSRIDRVEVQKLQAFKVLLGEQAHERRSQ